MNITKMAETIRQNPDGVTLDFNGNKVTPAMGYAVSITDNKTKKLNPFLLESLTAMALSLNTDKAFIGAWRDSQTGFFYIDITLIVNSRYIAEGIAQAFKQKAIFDFKTFQEIRLNATR